MKGVIIIQTVNKRFPANTSLDIDTFLNDKKVDSELYAFLQSYSKPYEIEDGLYETRVRKRELPPQGTICSTIGVSSPKTYKAHLQYLISKGYLIEWGDFYVLPNMEHIYFLIPLPTIQYLLDSCKEHVFKIYIYLGQRWKFKEGYEFSAEELGTHIGYSIKNQSRGYEMINNALRLLKHAGLISYTKHYNNKRSYYTLDNYSLEVKN